MAAVDYVSAEDVEQGDRINLSEVRGEIISSDILDIPTEFVTVDGDAEDVDGFTVRVFTSAGTVVVTRETLFPLADEDDE